MLEICSFAAREDLDLDLGVLVGVYVDLDLGVFHAVLGCSLLHPGQYFQ